jgi:hypothetical protein
MLGPDTIDDNIMELSRQRQFHSLARELLINND